MSLMMMRGRQACVLVAFGTRMAIVPCNTSKGYAGWCGQRSVARARSGLPHERPVQQKFYGSNAKSRKTHTAVKNDAAITLMSLPATGGTPAASVTPAGAHIEEID